MKIGQYLAKIWTKVCSLLFWPTLHIVFDNDHASQTYINVGMHLCFHNMRCRHYDIAAGSVLPVIARVIEQTSVVLVCFCDGFKGSPKCRTGSSV